MVRQSSLSSPLIIIAVITTGIIITITPHHLPHVQHSQQQQSNGSSSSHPSRQSSSSGSSPVNGSVLHDPVRRTTPANLNHHPHHPPTGPDRLSSLSQDQLSLCYPNLQISHQSLRATAGPVPQPQQPPAPAPEQAAQPSRWSTLPIQLLHRILMYLPLSDVYRVSLTCVSWSQVMREENNDLWTRVCNSKVPSSILKSDMLSSVRSCKGKVRALSHAWNPNDCSRNIYIKSNGLTLQSKSGGPVDGCSPGKDGIPEGTTLLGDLVGGTTGNGVRGRDRD